MAFPNPLYCTPEGPTTNDGSLNSPLPLWYVVGHYSNIENGHTIILKGGTYKGKFAFPDVDDLTIKSAPNEWAILQTDQHAAIALRVPGERATIRDLEVRNVSPGRSYPSTTAGLGGEYRNDAIYVFGNNSSIINVLAFDGLNGIPFFSNNGGTMYGCITANHGWLGNGIPHGHSTYTQNNGPDTKIIEQNVFIDPYSTGISAKAANTHVDHFIVKNNTVVRAASCINIYSHNFATEDLHFIGNRGYLTGRTGSVFFGAQPEGQEHRDVEIVNNWSVGCQAFTDDDPLFAAITWNRTPVDLTFTDNVIHSVNCSFMFEPDGTRSPDKVAPTVRNYARNAYYGGTAEPFQAPMGTPLTFAEWKGVTGQDADSTVTAGLPPARTWCDANAYEAGRGLITVWNPLGGSTVNVNASNVLSSSDTWYLYNALNPKAGPIASGTGQVVGCPMTVAAAGPNRTPAGMTAKDSTLPLFGVFILRTKSSWVAS